MYVCTQVSPVVKYLELFQQLRIAIMASLYDLMNRIWLRPTLW